jgi:putative nucleotidyltransferase with HDIG domain
MASQLNQSTSARDTTISGGPATGETGRLLPRRPEYDSRRETAQEHMQPTSSSSPSLKAEYITQQYRLLLDVARDALILSSAADGAGPGRILEANAAACALYGYSRDELLCLPLQNLWAAGLPSPILVPPDACDPAEELLLAQHRHKSGRTFPAEINLRYAIVNQDIVCLCRARAVDTQVCQNQQIDLVIAGWARAMEVRDVEPPGHAQRVTDLALQLAGLMGVPEADLVHLRRGALLHDIGKMAIPDSIQFKPGPLNDDEWEIMRRHPTYAQEMLAGIPFLVPALDIPAGHHEWWDSSGYPRGLKGAETPLAARIFAVADVWDALCSKRPYRRAWSAQQTIDYIKLQAGTHFDPQVVAALLRIPSLHTDVSQP